MTVKRTMVGNRIHVIEDVDAVVGGGGDVALGVVGGTVDLLGVVGGEVPGGTARVGFEATASLGITRTDDGATVSEFTREPDGRLVSMRRDGESLYYVPDGRGSVSVLTNGAGLTENVYRYGPYGNAEYALEATPQPFHWNAGYTIDGTTYKYGARYYDATIGRWTQVDPIPSEPRYAYAANDPINRSDPSGRIDIGFSPSDIIDTAADRLTDPSCLAYLAATAGSFYLVAYSAGLTAASAGLGTPATVASAGVAAGASAAAIQDCSESD